RIAMYTFGLNIVLNLLFLRWFYPVFRNGGPAFSTVIAAYFNFLALFVIFRVRFGRIGTLHILASMGRIAACAGLMGAGCWIALRLSHFNSYIDFLPRLGIFILLILCAALLYLGLAWALRCHEISEVYGVAVHGEHEPVGAAGMLP
ncbi:MAG TPA: hypothetical protein VGG55_01150, partial [Candidatus Acidoferrales bacterium]